MPSHADPIWPDGTFNVFIKLPILAISLRQLIEAGWQGQGDVGVEVLPCT
jgi:hypothetical protein